MSGSVIIAAYAARLSGRGGHEGQILPCLRAAAARLSEFIGAYRPLRSLPGNARFKCVEQSLRCFADVFQVNHSFRDAPEFHEQRDRSDVECPTKALKRLTR